MALSDNLISYWSLDEASGNALDAHGSNDLTETGGTIGATTGKVSGCRDFEADDGEHFEIADNADLSTGDIDFSLACWVQFEDLANTRFLVGKRRASDNNLEYWLLYSVVSSVFAFIISTDGSSTASVSATTFGAASTGTWYFVACGHNATTNELWISVNAGTPNTTPHSGGVYDGTAKFLLGNYDGATGNEHDGLLDEVGFWKRDIRSDLAELYNSGSGRDYAYVSGGGGGGLVIPVAMAQYRQRWN